MARYLLHKNCNDKMNKYAKLYSELFESLEGIAKDNFICDSCGEKIETGTECFAAVLLKDINHHNYKLHHPSVWAHVCIDTK